MSATAREALLAYARQQLPRVLTQMDRDPDSPTFGCFDRAYWHYKVRDFPSAILQQGAFTLEALRGGWLAAGDHGATGDRKATAGEGQRSGRKDGVAGSGVGETDVRGSAGGAAIGDVAERWCVAAVNALAGQVGRDGGVDEYYPYERSFPAAAFGLWTAARLATEWQTEAPHLLEKINWEPLVRLARDLGRRAETEAANQQAAALAGLALAAVLGPSGTAKAGERNEEQRIAPPLAGLATAAGDLEPHAARLFASQHAEGWFPEYGGPDFGYLTVTLDALADYHDVTGDLRAVAAADRAIDFLAAMVGADGRLPSTLNSRNTDYVVPYGLARAAARSPRAAWLVETLFAGAADPAHFLWATDDRYHVHYVYASCVRALPHLDRMLPPEPPPARESLWLPGCGAWVRWGADRSWTAYVAARKGGLVRVHRQGGEPLADHGWRLGRGRRVWTSNWWSDAWTVEREEEAVTVRGRCHQAGFLVPRPWKHALLRLLSWALGPRLLPWLRRRMIFRPGADSGPAFERRVEITDAGVTVSDRIAGAAALSPRRAPRQNLRHVASADSFSPEEVRPPAGPPGELDADGTLHAKWQWQAGESK